jgi:hypothetical protein
VDPQGLTKSEKHGALRGAEPVIAKIIGNTSFEAAQLPYWSAGSTLYPTSRFDLRSDSSRMDCVNGRRDFPRENATPESTWEPAFPAFLKKRLTKGN